MINTEIFQMTLNLHTEFYAIAKVIGNKRSFLLSFSLFTMQFIFYIQLLL